MVNDGFCMEKEENIFQRYIGRYVVIYPMQGSRSFAGKLVSLKDGYGILNPFQGATYEPEKGLVRKMIYDDSVVPILGAAVEPASIKDLESYCDSVNKPETKTGQANSK